jgi:hypothetical protein
VVFRNSRSASKEPRVEAKTQTPSEFLSTYLSKISIKLSSIYALAAAISASPVAFNNSEPAIACSRLGAEILIPIAPLIF